MLLCHAPADARGREGPAPRCLRLAEPMERCDCGWGSTKVEDGARGGGIGVRRPGLGWRKTGQGFSF